MADSASGLSGLIGSLYWKIAASVVLLFGLAGLGGFFLLTRTAELHALEVQQALSRDVAAAIVKHNSLFTEEGVDEKGLVAVDDQAGVTPTPTPVGLHPHVIITTQIKKTIFIKTNTELQHNRHRNLRA